MSQSPINIIAGIIPAFGYESLTVSNSVENLTSAEYTDSDGNRAVKALITIEGAQIRWRIDGTDPAANEGHLSNPFDNIVLNNSSDVRNFKAIRVGLIDATIRVTYSA